MEGNDTGRPQVKMLPLFFVGLFVCLFGVSWDGGGGGGVFGGFFSFLKPQTCRVLGKKSLALSELVSETSKEEEKQD